MNFEPYNNKKLLNFDKIKDKLFSDFETGKLHHSMMFIGNRGLGKATLCYHVANKILDTDSNLKKNAPTSLFGDVVVVSGLDDENPTFNLIKNKKHPDLLVIEKETDPKTSKVDKEIKVGSARKILDFMTLAPFASKNKVVIIDSIDEMNVSAQNAILKALEEPLKNTYVLLVCHNKNNVLETIQSRCREMRIQNHGFNEWKSIMDYIGIEKFKSLDKDKQAELHELSDGSIDFAVDIIEENGQTLYNTIEIILAEKVPNVEDIQSLGDYLNNNETMFNLFSNFILLFLYKTLKYFTLNKIDEAFKIKNHNFILKNNEKSILDKIKFTQEILSDINKYNLSKKHGIIVLFRELIK